MASPLVLGNRSSVRRWLTVGALVLVAGFTVAAALVLMHWPFRREAIAQDLADGAAGKVEMKSFRETYFPPGCVAEGVTFRLPSGRAPLVSVRRLTIEGSYLGLLSRRVNRIIAEGLLVSIETGPGTRTQPNHSTEQRAAKKSTLLKEVIADGAVLQLRPAQPGSEQLIFRMRKLRLTGFAVDRGGEFETLFENPLPPAMIEATGHIGRLRGRSLAQIPVEGQFTLDKANLGVFRAIAGTLSAKGQFNGVLDRIAVRGTTQMPDFEVTETRHRMPMTLAFHAVVNGMTGDVSLQELQGRIQNTVIAGKGTVLGKPGKTVTAGFTSTQGRIEDLFMLFSKDPRSPISGAIRFRMTAHVPPEKRKFVDKITGEGDFDIPEARFTSENTQFNVDKLSEHARGDTKDKDIEQVVAHLKGHVTMREGVATFSDSTFSVPGGTALASGTYRFLDHRVDLKGTLRMEAKLSQATTGMKSFFARFINSRFETRNAGAELPITVTGTSKHPQFHVDLKGKPDKDNKVSSSAGKAR